jgi:copper oxidase (laccase) domain-containing protein
MEEAETDRATEIVERFAALDGPGCGHAFLGRVPGVDVSADRATALARLDDYHRAARAAAGAGALTLVTAEQVHGRELAVLRQGETLAGLPWPGADGLLTDRGDVCLGIYVADCCAVYLADPAGGAIGLVHAGRKGTELGIVPAAVAAMEREFGAQPGNLIVQLSPCIRPPWYEVDFAPEIVRQARAAGVGSVVDCGICTAADPERYYSYRREKGRTGRMLALLWREADCVVPNRVPAGQAAR